MNPQNTLGSLIMIHTNIQKINLVIVTKGIREIDCTGITK